MGGTKSPLPGTSLFVDWFYSAAGRGAAEYFLTHFHADHMDGLTQGWARGALHCSEITARLLAELRKVNRKALRAHPVDEPFEVTDPLSKRRLTVTFVDAGHCPGSIMVVLEGFADGPIVHTGDFRYYEGLAHSSSLRRVAESGRCSRVYLDTSWAHEAFTHLPAKATSVNQLLDLIDRYPGEAIVLHSHGLGDEELLAAVACRFPHEKFLFVDPARLKELRLSSPDLHGLGRFMTLDGETTAGVQSNPHQRFFIVKNRRQRRRLQLEGVEINCSTLWWAKAVHNEVQDINQPIKSQHTGAWHVLWAMHSSLAELQHFVSWLRPRHLEGICPPICHEDSPTDWRSRFLSHMAEEWRPKGELVPQRVVRPHPSQSPASQSSSPGAAVAVRKAVLASAASYRAELRQHRHVKLAPMTPRRAAGRESDTGKGNGADSLLGMLDNPSPGTASSAGHGSSPPAATAAAAAPETSQRPSCSPQSPLVSPGLPVSMSPETLAVGSAAAASRQRLRESPLVLDVGSPERSQQRQQAQALNASPDACASTQLDDSLGNSETATLPECPDTEVEEEEDTGDSCAKAGGDVFSILWASDSSADKVQGNACELAPTVVPQPLPSGVAEPGVTDSTSSLTPTVRLSHEGAPGALTPTVRLSNEHVPGDLRSTLRLSRESKPDVPKEVIVVEDGESDVEKGQMQAQRAEPCKRKQWPLGNSGKHGKRNRRRAWSSALLQQSSDMSASLAPQCTVGAVEAECCSV